MNSNPYIDYSGLGENKDELKTGKINILAAGVGGAGGNVVRRMIENDLKLVNYAAINTDQAALNNNPAEKRITIGKNLTKGLGAGMKPEVARASALEDIDEIRQILEDTDMLFIAAGMGGGTGTGASPVLAEVAKELDILTIAVVTTPFNFEGKDRMELALKGIEELKKYIDTVITVPNERLMSLGPLSVKQAFGLADDVLKNAIFGVANLINGETEINVDFADVCTVLREKGKAFIGMGVGEGETRGEKAAKQAMNSPILNNHIIQEATGIIIHMEADPNFTLQQVNQSAEIIRSQAKNISNKVIWGYQTNSKLENKVIITLIAAGFEHAEKNNTQLSDNKETEESNENFVVLEEEQIQDTPHVPDEYISDQEKQSDIDIPTYLRNQKHTDNLSNND